MLLQGLEEGSLPCRREFEGEDVQGTMDQTRMDEGAPDTVTPVDRYVRDLVCLRELTSSAEPPKQLYRAERQAAFFVIGDASGKAKGNAVVEQYGVDYESGAWNLEWREKSSNCREIGTPGSRRGSQQSRGFPYHRQRGI